MKLCLRALHWTQLISPNGDVRLCSWIHDSKVGNLLQNTMPEIMHGDRMREIVSAMAAGDYSGCDRQACPYLSNHKLEEMLVDADEIPDYPEHMSLSFEHRCNFRCTGCFSYHRIVDTGCHDYAENYRQIEEKLGSVLPHIKHIGANGAGEVFASPRTLKLLAGWKPLAPPEKCGASLETNGSLFTPENWKKIENLGQYNLTVSITALSFQEDIYRFLSGTKLPVSVIENNLKFVRSLREKGVVNNFRVGSVMQEANFREMPGFIRKCLDEYGADSVFIRQIRPGGHYNRHIQWFLDVRNPEHPYYGLYRQVMDDPIFRDPRVRTDSGDLPSELGEVPGLYFERRLDAIQSAANKLLDDPGLLLRKLGPGKLGIFGLGTLGRLIVSQYAAQAEIKAIYMTSPKAESWHGVPIRRLCDAGGDPGSLPDTVLVTAYRDFENISRQIREYLGKDVKAVSLWDIVK